MSKHTFKVGDKVKLTSKFLRSTGQYVGGEGSKRWTVLRIGHFVIVDEEISPAMLQTMFSTDELAADPSLKYRRIAAGNLMLASKPDVG